MSGGVDSAVAAALLAEEGYRVFGITCDFHIADSNAENSSDDARAVCDVLGIPHVHVDCREQFATRIVDAVVRDCRMGLTPSPCVSCNRLVKFPVLFEAALDLGCNYIATGHYASIHMVTEGMRCIFKGRDNAKDQSYMLAYVTRDILAKLVLPLGGMTKCEVRAYAEKLHLPVAHKQDSQDICFAPHGYRALLASCGMSDAPGDFVDASGAVLGSHTGFSDYTIGQRKGIGIAAPEPLYVLEKQPAQNRILVGTKSEAVITGVIVRDVVWQAFADEPESVDAEAKLRYRSSQVRCHVESLGGGRYRVELENEQEITAPGQFAVFYNGECVLGAGVIESVIRSVEA